MQPRNATSAILIVSCKEDLYKLDDIIVQVCYYILLTLRQTKYSHELVNCALHQKRKSILGYTEQREFATDIRKDNSCETQGRFSHTGK